MSEQHRFLVGGVALVKGRTGSVAKELATIKREIGALLEKSEWFPDAPFDCIHVVVRFGDRSDASPQIGCINRHHELEAAIEVPMAAVAEYMGRPRADRYTVLRNAIFQTLHAIAVKYRLHPLDLPPVGVPVAG
jgi:hypothetical protein